MALHSKTSCVLWSFQVQMVENITVALTSLSRSPSFLVIIAKKASSTKTCNMSTVSKTIAWRKDYLLFSKDYLLFSLSVTFNY